MKKILLALAVFGMFSVPLFAQEEGEVGGEESGTEQPKAKTKAELKAELIKLMRKASEEMGEVERELAKASRDAPKADVVAERIRKVREAMESGKLDDLPEGLRKHIEENPEDIAEMLGKSAEELKELAKDEAKLREVLEKNPEALKKLAESEDTMEKIIEAQHEAEKQLAETLKHQEESAEKARQNVDDALETAHTLRQMGQGQGQGEGKSKDNKSQTEDKKKDGKQSQNGNSKSNQGAKEQYGPNGGKKVEMDDGEYDRLDKDGFQADGKEKKSREAGSNDDNQKVPDKYKGFFEKWRREAHKKAEERKNPNKTTEEKKTDGE